MERKSKEGVKGDHVHVKLCSFVPIDSGDTKRSDREEYARDAGSRHSEESAPGEFPQKTSMLKGVQFFADFLTIKLDQAKFD